MSDLQHKPHLPGQIVAERTHLSIPSLPDWIEPTVEFLRHKAVMAGACQETRSGKLLVALHEAITNAMIHGNLELSSELKEQGNNVFAAELAQRAADTRLSSRLVDIMVDYDGTCCRWIITDQGPGFDVERVLARCLSDDPEILLASGRGILMMKTFLDDVQFALGGRRAILSLLRTSGAEKRRDPRVPMNSPFQVTPIGVDGEPDWTATYEAISRNFSEGGVSLLQQHLADASKVLIGIPTSTGILHIPAHVKHSRSLGGQGMELGCQFDDPSKPRDYLSGADIPVSPQLEEVHRAVTNLLSAHHAHEVPAHEMRLHRRVVYTERVAIFLRGRGEPVVGFARDLSKGGIAVITQEPLPADVTIRLTPHGTDAPLNVRCRVVRCTLIQEGFYDVGAAFLHIETF